MAGVGWLSDVRDDVVLLVSNADCACSRDGAIAIVNVQGSTEGTTDAVICSTHSATDGCEGAVLLHCAHLATTRALPATTMPCRPTSEAPVRRMPV